MVEIQNFTGKLDDAEAFIRAKFDQVDHTGVSIHIKHTRAKGRDLNGYYRFADRRIVVAVKKRLRFPRDAAYGVGSVTVDRRSLGGRPFKLVWHEDTFRNADDLAVFAAGHEMWHFLCHSGQRRGDFETRANCNGFLWLSEFRTWDGSTDRLRPIPARPPRPDLPNSEPAPAPELAGWIQGELFPVM
jgi:hypothetical protein